MSTNDKYPLGVPINPQTTPLLYGWEKPELRARLEEARKPKAPTDGLTDIKEKVCAARRRVGWYHKKDRGYSYWNGSLWSLYLLTAPEKMARTVESMTFDPSERVQEYLERIFADAEVYVPGSPS